MFGAIFVNLGSILVSFWCHFRVPGGLLATLGPQGIPQGSRVEKVTKKLVRGSSPELLNRHSVDTEWSFLKSVFFLRFFVMLLNCRSVRTELDFLTKMSVR